LQIRVFFSIFSYNFIKGNPLTCLSQPNSIVLNADFAKTLFGKVNPIGKIITRNNKLPLIVTGVVDHIPANETYQFDYVMPYVIFESENSWAKNANWGSNFCQTYVQLKDQHSLVPANSILKGMVNKYQNGDKNQLFLFPFAKFHLYDKFENGESVGGSIDQIHLFEVLSLCILLIACVNFMNLSTARSAERAKEVGIRKAIGARDKDIIGQFLSESVVLCVI